MKKIVTKAALVSVLFCAPIVAASPASNVSATTNSHKAGWHTNKSWSKRLAKAGYVFRLTNASKGALYRNNGKSYSKKILRKIINNNTLFKVEQVRIIHNGVFVSLVSKDGKYTGYTTYVNAIYNKDLLNEDLKPLIKAELSVMQAKDNGKPTDELLNQAETLAVELTGHNRKIALTSINQLKGFIKRGTVAETPVLLIGAYPGSALDK